MSHKLLYFAILLCGIIAFRLQFLNYRKIRFNEYLRKFNKSYSDEEFNRRMLYFEESLEEIRKLNNEEATGAVHGHTKFSDWSKEEISNFMMKYEYTSEIIVVNNCEYGITVPRQYGPVPERLDWREHDGVIGPVGNQKQCNGCWAFSIVGTMSSMAAIRNLGTNQLSVQELLDCTKGNGDCKGGNINTALKYLCRMPVKLTTEDSYPLSFAIEGCRLTNLSLGLRGIMNYTTISDVDDVDIIKNLVHGPVIAIINGNTLMSYNSGIIQHNCSPEHLSMVHVVTIIGYDSVEDEDTGQSIDYYIIKNSYGTDWGEDGYMRIMRGNNLCGLNDHIAFFDVY